MSLTAIGSLAELAKSIIDIVKEERDPIKAHMRIINKLESKIDEYEADITEADDKIIALTAQGKTTEVEAELRERQELIEARDRCKESIKRRNDDFSEEHGS